MTAGEHGDHRGSGGDVVLLVELKLGDRRADVGRGAALELGAVCTTSPPIAAARARRGFAVGTNVAADQRA